MKFWVSRFRRDAFLRRRHKNANVLLADRVSQGVALGYGQQLGLQPAPRKAIVAGRFAYCYLNALTAETM